MRYLETSFVIASIMKTKNKHYHESFVTSKELNDVKNALQKRFNKEGLGIIIVDDIDSRYFKFIDGIIVKNDITVESLINIYIGYTPSIDLSIILWDDSYIFNLLENIKNEYESKSLEIIINKILDNPKLFYENVAHQLTDVEYNFIKSKLDKSCDNCQNSCGETSLCDRWKNDELIGRSKILSKN